MNEKKSPFLHFIETLAALKNSGGNYYFEQKLFEKIGATGKTVDETTVAEFLEYHAAAAREYNEMEMRLESHRAQRGTRGAR